MDTPVAAALREAIRILDPNEFNNIVNNSILRKINKLRASTKRNCMHATVERKASSGMEQLSHKKYPR